MRYKYLTARTSLLPLMIALCLPAHASQTTTHLTRVGTSSIGNGGKGPKTLGKFRATMDVDSDFNKNAKWDGPRAGTFRSRSQARRQYRDQ
jgi:hypothetical protein